MKEYLKFKYTRGNRFHTQIYVLIFYKDSNRIIVHREKDKPAAIWNDGELAYYKNGKYLKYERIS
jgi:hypothetical protein